MVWKNKRNVLEKSKIVESEDLERVNREIKFLKKLKNKHIIKIFEVPFVN